MLEPIENLASADAGSPLDDLLFARVAKDIETQGYSVQPGALPNHIADVLFQHQQLMDGYQYNDAGVGRGDGFLRTEFVRNDEICWISGESPAGQLWLDWAGLLQRYLNRRLFLGLFSFESHFAHYAPGHYYKRHYDAFRGQANRVLSVAAYLNKGWVSSHAGELVIYRDEDDRSGIKVAPLYGTLVVFLSEQFPHEVLPAGRDRYSVAGWFRVNSSLGGKVDPPG